MASSSSLAVGTPCGACKFLRRKCAPDCVFAPFFCPEQGPERFATIHKVFGASNVSKLLLRVPVHARGDAILTVEYEARARIQDPVFGSVAHIQALQQQVTCLEARLMQLKAQVAHNNMIQGNYNQLEAQQRLTRAFSTSSISMMPRLLLGEHIEACYKNNAVSPQSSIESTSSIIDRGDNFRNGSLMMDCKERQDCSKRQRTSSSGYSQYEWSELQELALNMMKD